MTIDHIQSVENRIKKQDGVRVSVHDAAETVLKFGQTDEASTTPSTVWAGIDGGGDAHETMLTTNAITHLVSTSGTDTVDMTVIGQTVTTGDLSAYVTQNVTLTGQTKAELSTPLARVHRMYVAGAVSLVGVVTAIEDVTVSDGVADTSAAVHATIIAGNDQTYKAAIGVPFDRYLILSNWTAAILRQTATSVATLTLETLTAGGVWLPKATTGVTSTATNSAQRSFDPFLIIPPNHDVRVSVELLSGSGVSVAATFGGTYARVIGTA